MSYIFPLVLKLLLKNGKKNRIVFLTGNPGDGKTYIIRAIEPTLKQENIYVEKDLNSVTDEGNRKGNCEYS